MIKTIGSYCFVGFYESIFSNSDEFIDDECEVADELSLDTDYEVEVEYEYVDFKQYQLDVCNKFMECYIEKVIDELPYDIVDDDEFQFEMVEGSVWVSSPRYYNFETDKCYCEIDTNTKTLDMIKDHTLNLEGAEQYIINHFTSRDGFISFISNDIGYWKSLPIEEYEDNMLISLLDMMLNLSDEDAFNDINYDVLDSVCKYEYVECYVHYDGDTYSLSDFEELVAKE